MKFFMVNYNQKYDDYYKNHNRRISVYNPVYEKHMWYHTDIFHIVMDKLKRNGYQNHRVVQRISSPEKFFARFFLKSLTPDRIFIRLNWEIFVSNGNNMYFVTLNKVGRIGGNKKKSRNLLDEFLKILRKELYGRKPKQYLSGFVFEEKGVDSSYHYHIIFSDDNGSLTNNIDSFLNSVSSTIDSMNKRCKRSNELTGNSKKAFQNNCWDVQKYYPDRLEQYVTKSMEKGKTFEASQSFGLISKPDENGLQHTHFG